MSSLSSNFKVGIDARMIAHSGIGVRLYHILLYLSKKSMKPDIYLFGDPELLKKYPEFVTVNKTRKSGYPEIRLRDTRKKKSKPSHLKPDFSVHAGLQQRLNKLKYTYSKERSTYQHWPIQRDQGLIVGLTLNNKWILEWLR